MIKKWWDIIAKNMSVFMEVREKYAEKEKNKWKEN